MQIVGDADQRIQCLKSGIGEEICAEVVVQRQDAIGVQTRPKLPAQIHGGAVQEPAIALLVRRMEKGYVGVGLCPCRRRMVFLTEVILEALVAITIEKGAVVEHQIDIAIALIAVELAQMRVGGRKKRLLTDDRRLMLIAVARERADDVVIDQPR